MLSMKLPSHFQNLLAIGRGSTGNVYRAYDTEKLMYVAIKEISNDKFKPEEIESMSHLGLFPHPNILRLYQAIVRMPMKCMYYDMLTFDIER